jgi:single-stranded-DNA-specific exonuclease
MANSSHSKRWKICQSIPDDINQKLASYPPFFRQILFARNIVDEQNAAFFLNGAPQLGDPFQMTGMEPAVARVARAIEDDELIAVYGDFDVDGVTATVLFTEVLKFCGAQVLPYIPNRFEEGYGLNVEALESLAKQGVKLVVTVDCGIRSPGEARRARELGMDLIISDHHHPDEDIPQAVAVICPRQPGDQYPDKNLSGVGLAFKMALALQGYRPGFDLDAEDWLELVAIGTVADIVPLKGENRDLVRRGLQKLRFTNRRGLVALSNVARISLPQITAGDIAFMLAPRLNAAGRLDTALDSLRLLMTSDGMEAGKLAQQLDNQNRERQVMTQRVQAEAIRLVSEGEVPPILFAFSPDFGPGIVGLAASRLVDMKYRPAIVGFEDVENKVTRASCRSIPEFHITEALDECKSLLIRHGGHALAAGFTVKTENLEELKYRLLCCAREKLDGLEDLRSELRVDIEIHLCDLKPEFLPYLDKLQPTGSENPEAVFVSRELLVTKSSTVGADGKHLRLTVKDGGIVYDAIAFGMGDRRDSLSGRIDMAYLFEKNIYNGRESLQLRVRDFKASGIPD